MSERQLVLALAAGGRTVSLTELVAWRGDGLLPPLASTGVHNGRSYYWREPDILEQAETVHDALQRHGRVDIVIITLWLNGFEVPLARLRRAWLHSLKLRKPRQIRRAAPAAKTAIADLSQLLQQAALAAAAALAPDEGSQAALALLERVAVRLGLAKSQARPFWHQVQMTAGVLAASDLIRRAGDAEMARAQRLLRSALDFIQESGEAENRALVAEALGETLFLYILALLCSGQDAILEDAQARIEAWRRRPAADVRPLHVRA